jgi:hypothetical protein
MVTTAARSADFTPLLVHHPARALTFGHGRPTAAQLRLPQVVELWDLASGCDACAADGRAITPAAQRTRPLCLQQRQAPRAPVCAHTGAHATGEIKLTLMRVQMVTDRRLSRSPTRSLCYVHLRLACQRWYGRAHRQQPRLHLGRRLWPLYLEIDACAADQGRATTRRRGMHGHSASASGAARRSAYTVTPPPQGRTG